MRASPVSSVNRYRRAYQAESKSCEVAISAISRRWRPPMPFKSISASGTQCPGGFRTSNRHLAPSNFFKPSKANPLWIARVSSWKRSGISTRCRAPFAPRREPDSLTKRRAGCGVFLSSARIQPSIKPPPGRSRSGKIEAPKRNPASDWFQMPGVTPLRRTRSGALPKTVLLIFSAPGGPAEPSNCGAASPLPIQRRASPLSLLDLGRSPLQHFFECLPLFLQMSASRPRILAPA